MFENMGFIFLRTEYFIYSPKHRPLSLHARLHAGCKHEVAAAGPRGLGWASLNTLNKETAHFGLA